MNQTKTSDNELQIVSFYLDNHIYGFDIQIVKEVNPNIVIRQVPLSAETIHGVVNIRGQIVLVLDIAVIFGHAKRPVFPESHLVVLKTEQELTQNASIKEFTNAGIFGDKPVAFLVDKAGDVIMSSTAMIEKPPRHLNDVASRFIKGVLRIGEKVIIILNAEQILAHNMPETGTIVKEEVTTHI